MDFTFSTYLSWFHYFHNRESTRLQSQLTGKKHFLQIVLSSLIQAHKKGSLRDQTSFTHISEIILDVAWKVGCFVYEWNAIIWGTEFVKLIFFFLEIYLQELKNLYFLWPSYKYKMMLLYCKIRRKRCVFFFFLIINGLFAIRVIY